MKLYKDINKKHEIKNLDLGVVEAGKSKTFEYYIYNDSKATLEEVAIEVSHHEVKILSAPEILTPWSTAKVRLEWNPSITLKEGLKTLLRITASEIWG